MREGLRSVLAQDADIETVGEASDGRMALSLVKSLAPDVVLMDVSMPVMNGIEATRLISAEHGHVRVIALSTYSDKEYVDAMLAAGACGYVLKSEAHDTLLHAVHAASLDAIYLSPDVAAPL
jgi:DNA-binding NarL/FixJ family response regulator